MHGSTEQRTSRPHKSGVKYWRYFPLLPLLFLLIVCFWFPFSTPSLYDHLIYRAASMPCTRLQKVDNWECWSTLPLCLGKIPPEGQQRVHPSSLGSSAGPLSSSTLPHWRTSDESAWQRQGVCNVNRVSEVQRLCMFCYDTVCSIMSFCDNIKGYVAVCILMY